VISPTASALVTTGQVTHALAEVEARTLGRYPGQRHRVPRPGAPGDELFCEAIKRMLGRHAHNQHTVLDPDRGRRQGDRVLERLSTALDNAGFSVATADERMEAIGACLSRTPDVALIERDMPVVDGFHSPGDGPPRRARRACPSS